MHVLVYVSRHASIEERLIFGIAYFVHFEILTLSELFVSFVRALRRSNLSEVGRAY